MIVGMKRRPGPRDVARRLLGRPASEHCAATIRKAIRQIPRGKVATYGQVAAAAGYPLHHRQVAQVLRKSGDSLPWQRVLGAGGQIRFRGAMALEQRLRLEMEGVTFRGARVDMARHQHVFRTWDF
jgi:methylated-DNA-protein-cysteine methyltransferase related protein